MTLTHTNHTVLSTAGLDTVNLEFPELAIPVLTGIQRQGDLVVVPTSYPVPGLPIAEGVAVVEAESNAENSHILVGEGEWLRAVGDQLVEGWLTVPDGAEAFLIHTEEHNALGIGPGSYEIRRQREWDLAAATSDLDARRRADDEAEEAARRRVIEERMYRRVRD